MSYTPVTKPVIDSSNPLGEGKILDAVENAATGKIEITPGEDDRSYEGGILGKHNKRLGVTEATR